MPTGKIVKVLLILALVAALALAFTGRAGSGSPTYMNLTRFLIFSGFIAGFLAFRSKYGKEFLVPAFGLILIHYVGGNTLLNTISMQDMQFGESFTGLYKFLLAFTIVVCFKEIFYAFKD